MATELMKFRGYYEGTKAEFITNAKATADAQGLVVYIQDKANNGAGACIYAQGTFFANFKELIAALAFVKGVKVGSDSYNAANGGGYVEFAATDPSKLSLDVQNGKLTFGLTEAFVKSVNDVIAQSAEIAADYLTSEDREALEGLIATAKSEAIAAVVGNANTDTKDSKTIEGVRKYVEAKTADIASNTDFSTLKGRVDTIEGDYLKNADKEALQGAINTEKGRVDAIVADYLKAADKTELANSIKAISDDYLKAADKTELANRITNEAPVTMSEAAGSGDVLKTYTFTQNGKEIGKINLAKDLVVSGGQVVEKEGVKYLQLTIANQSEPVEIAVSDLVDVYTGSEFVNISEGNVISVDKAGIIAGLASEEFVNGKISAEVERANAAYEAKGDAAKAQAAAEAKAKELADAAEAAAKAHAESKASAAETAAKGYADAEVAKAKTYAEEKAAAAETNAKGYADSLAVNYATAAQGAKADAAAPQATTYTKTEVDSMFGWVKL